MAPISSIGVFLSMSVMLDLAAFTWMGIRETFRFRWKRSCARVAERQTRWLQVPVSERVWGFKSPLAHANGKSPGLRTGALFVKARLGEPFRQRLVRGSRRLKVRTREQAQDPWTGWRH